MLSVSKAFSSASSSSSETTLKKGFTNVLHFYLRYYFGRLSWFRLQVHVWSFDSDSSPETDQTSVRGGTYQALYPSDVYTVNKITY